MTTSTLRHLIQTASYDSSFAIYAEKIDGEFRPNSPARFGQAQFKNGGLLDDKVFFMSNEDAHEELRKAVESFDEPTQADLDEAADWIIDQENEEIASR